MRWQLWILMISGDGVGMPHGASSGFWLFRADPVLDWLGAQS